MSDPTTPPYQPADTPHTGWCVQENCSPGVHRGRLVEVTPERGSGFDVLTLQVVQPTGAPDPYFLVNGECLVSINQARYVVFMLRYQLRRVLHLTPEPGRFKMLGE